jgi:hypothetical protein
VDLAGTLVILERPHDDRPDDVDDAHDHYCLRQPSAQHPVARRRLPPDEQPQMARRLHGPRIAA